MAVFLYGEYRQFEQAVNLYKDKLQRLRPDYYISTWDYSREKCELGTYDEEHIVTEDKIKKYLPKSVISIRKDKNRMGKATDKIYESMCECLNICKKVGKKYDIILVKRLDQFERYDDSLFDNLDVNCFYSKPSMDRKFDFSDLFFFGGFKQVTQFIEEFYKETLNNTKYFVHTAPAKYLHYSDIPVRAFPTKVSTHIIRPTMVNLLKKIKSHDELTKNILKSISQLDGKWYSQLKYTISKV